MPQLPSLPSTHSPKPLAPLSEASLQARIRELQKELGPQIQRGNRTSDDVGTRYHPSGFEDVDGLLGGGFPSGCLSEICGPASSGRTSLALALLCQTTRTGAYVAVVDCADAFDPPSAEAAGVVLERVLWVRAPDTRAGLRCSERLLQTEGFPLVVMDLSARMTTPITTSRTTRRGPSKNKNEAGRRNSIPKAAWLRLTRLAAKRRSALILLSDERLAGASAAVALEMQPAIPRFSGSPPLLEELETHAVLVRHQSAPRGRLAKVKLGVASNAA